MTTTPRMGGILARPGRDHWTSPEFKDEAVRQVTERGYKVVEVAARLGVSNRSLYKWVRFWKAHRLDPSMSRRGNCRDNAVAESFFCSLKKERIRKKIYRTRSLARADIFDYVGMFYNRTRRHSHLGDVSPEAFESASELAL